MPVRTIGQESRSIMTIAQRLLISVAALCMISFKDAMAQQQYSPPDSLETSQVQSYSIVPQKIQGVWSNDCNDFYSGATPSNDGESYNIFGPNSYITAVPQGLYENNNVIKIIETSFGFAMVEDVNSEGANSSPQIVVNIYKSLGAGEIQEFADFNRNNSSAVRYFSGPGYVSSKCASDPAFNQNISLSQAPHLITDAEIAASNATVAAMPAVAGIQWNGTPLPENGTQETASAPSPVMPVNPMMGPSFPCPQPKDPLAQLICTTPQLAMLDMQFVQTYEALYQQAGAAGQSGIRQMDVDSELNIRAKCGIALAQPHSSSVTPPPAPPGADACVDALEERQISQWKGMLQGPALEEANRPIQDQVALQARLQTLGFLSSSDPLDGAFGPATRVAITNWQASQERLPTGILGDADAQALSGPTSSPATQNPVAAPTAAQPSTVTSQPSKPTSSNMDNSPSQGDGNGNIPTLAGQSNDSGLMANVAFGFLAVGTCLTIFFSRILFRKRTSALAGNAIRGVISGVVLIITGFIISANNPGSNSDLSDTSSSTTASTSQQDGVTSPTNANPSNTAPTSQVDTAVSQDSSSDAPSTGRDNLDNTPPPSNSVEDDIQQAEAEDSGSFDRKPTPQSISYAVQQWLPIVSAVNRLSSQSYGIDINAIAVSFTVFQDAHTFPDGVYDTVRETSDICENIDNNSNDEIIHNCAQTGLIACEYATAQFGQVLGECRDFFNIR